MAEEPAVSGAGELYERIASFENLCRAARRAARGKRSRPDVAAFLCDLEHEVLCLEEALRDGGYAPAGYRTFVVEVPKRRLISAAPFRDRVVHQAVVQVVEPLLEAGFVFDSYACRRGKGTHAAVRRVAGWAKRYRWALRVDVEKYFASVDHEVALAQMALRVRCVRTLDLLRAILASWRSDDAPVRWYPGDDLLAPLGRPRGLPIGNLTSQLLANVVLDPVDHLVKDELGVRAYARYCDDMVVFGGDRDDLRCTRDAMRRALATLRLRPHPRKTAIQPTAQGVPWLGFVIGPHRIELRPAAVRRLRRRMRALAHGVARGDRAVEEVRSSLAGTAGFVRLAGFDGRMAAVAREAWASAVAPSPGSRRGRRPGAAGRPSGRSAAPPGTVGREGGVGRDQRDRRAAALTAGSEGNGPS